MSISFSLSTQNGRATYRLLMLVGLACAGCGVSNSFDDKLASESQGMHPLNPCLLRPSVYQGNVNIVGEAQAAAFACISEVNGDVTVQGDRVPASGALPAFVAGLTLSMPNLRRVTGNLTINADHASSIAFDSLAEVGGKFSLSITRFWGVSYPGGGAPVVATVVTNLSAPALTSVGGDVELHAQCDLGVGGSSATFDFGLDALTTVGGSVLVDQPFIPGEPRGLRNLVTVLGNVVIDQPSQDFSDNNLLTNLDSIGGDLEVTTNPNFRYLLPALTAVGGTVTLTTVSGTIDGGVLPLLRTVGRDVALSNYGVGTPYVCTVLGSLSYVGGTFRISGGRISGYYGIASGPNFGGIDVGDANGSLIPFSAATTIHGFFPGVRFHDNAELCPCQVDRFTAALGLSRWLLFGAVVNTGNGASVACPGTCPQPTCP